MNVEQVCSDKKVGGDSWSKIVFKHLVRTSPITIEDIAAALIVSAPSGDDHSPSQVSTTCIRSEGLEEGGGDMMT